MAITSDGCSTVKLLDCTLRDGGYYNDWDFSIAETQDYIDNLARGGIDIIEVGFRFTPKARFLGPFAYTTEATLAQLEVPEGVTLGVMINASDYMGESGLAKLSSAFVPAAKSHVSLVRIAAHIEQVSYCDQMVAWLKERGYDVGFNIMQISQAADAQITALIETVESKFVPFEALYFADSLGNLTTDDVTRIVSLFRASSNKPIGFHGHDNIGLGVANSMAALAAGATWVDATVTGMGRGAGNTQTEYLSLEMDRRGVKAFSLLDIQRAATGWLAELKAKCGWGTNIFYYEAGLQSLHPSYVQQLLQSKRYEPVDILVMINALAGGETPTSYREANIDAALAEVMHAPEGTDDVSGHFEGRPVLLVASGPQAKRHWQAISARAKATNAVVLAVNHIGGIAPAHFDGVVSVHPARMMALLDDKAWADLPLYTSRNSLPKSVVEVMGQCKEIIDYGVEIEDSAFSHGTKGCKIPMPEAFAYAWALAEQGGASEILLAGFDGFDGQGPAFARTEALVEVLKAQSTLPVYTLTASHLSFPHASLYAQE